MSTQISEAITGQERQTEALGEIMHKLQRLEEHVLEVIRQQQQKSTH